LEKRRILVAEDTELFLVIESSFLKRDSFELYTARTGKEALEKALKVQPHLVLLSFMMPDIGGDEICSAIKANPKLIDTRVVIVTADHSQESHTRCIDAGCDGIVTRPFGKDQLLETVQKLLGQTFRRKPRYRVDIPCALYLANEAIPAIMVDISEIGCRVKMEESVDGDLPLGVGFNLPDTEHSVNWTGKIQWNAGSGSELSAGIEFVQPPEDEVEILADILAVMDASERL
jgi:CheY-like chemotaxis protein